MVTVISKDDSPPGYSESVQTSSPTTNTPAPSSYYSNAESYVDQHGCDVSFDPAINKDPIAMAEFIRSKAVTPPEFIVQIKGSHTEREIIHESHHSNHHGSGVDHHHDSSSHHHDHHHNSHSHTTTSATVERQRTVVDFDFSINISKTLALKPEFFVLADNIATYRGQTVMEIDYPGQGRHQASAASQENTKALQKGEKERSRQGEVPWQLQNRGGTLSLEQWCQQYTREPGVVKDFKFSKIVYGWDLNAVEEAIREAVSSELYSGKVEVEFKTPKGNAVHVRPMSPFSKGRASGFTRFLMNATLVWPITYYLCEQQWRTCGAAYALKQWVHVPDSLPGEDVAGYAARTGQNVNPNKLQRTPAGLSELRGIREGEWFARWEQTVKNAVHGRFKNSYPLTDPLGAPSSSASKLDGYIWVQTPGAGPSTSI